MLIASKCRILFLILFVTAFFGLGSSFKTQAQANRSSYKVSGVVYFQKDKKPKSDVDVVLFQIERDASGKVIRYLQANPLDKITTNQRGEFELKLFSNVEYAIMCEKEGFGAPIKIFEPRNVAEGENVSIEVALDKYETYPIELEFVDQRTRMPIEQVEATLNEMPKGLMLAKTTHKTGKASFMVDPNKYYRLSGMRKGYFALKPDTLWSGTSNKSISSFRIFMNPIILGESITFPDFFEINDTKITPLGESTLNSIYYMLLANPDLKIEIRSHTDSRGDDTYNIHLSEERAKVCAIYLHELGIENARIRSKGQGETQLLNQCANNVKCENHQHAENRRIEVVFVGLGG